MCCHKERVSGQALISPVYTSVYIFVKFLGFFTGHLTLLTATCADSPIPEISPEAFYVESDI